MITDVNLDDNSDVLLTLHTHNVVYKVPVHCEARNFKLIIFH